MEPHALFSVCKAWWATCIVADTGSARRARAELWRSASVTDVLSLAATHELHRRLVGAGYDLRKRRDGPDRLALIAVALARLRRRPRASSGRARRRLGRADVSRPAAAQPGLGDVAGLVRGRRTPGRDTAPRRPRLLHLRAGSRRRRAWHRAGLAALSRAVAGSRRTGRARRRVRRIRQLLLRRARREGSPQAARAQVPQVLRPDGMAALPRCGRQDRERAPDPLAGGCLPESRLRILIQGYRHSD